MHFGGIVKVRFSGWHLFLGVHCVFFSLSLSLHIHVYVYVTVWIIENYTHIYTYIFYVFLYDIHPQVLPVPFLKTNTFW